MVVSAIAGKFKVPPLYLIIFCSIIQTIGFALLSFIPPTTTVSARQLGFQVLAGFGCGANMTLLTVMTRYMVAKRDFAVAQGSIGQIRYLGAVIGVAIVTCTLNSYVASHLHLLLPEAQITAVLQSSSAFRMLGSDLQHTVRLVFAKAYNIQMRILIGFSAAQVPASLMMWQRDQVVLGVTEEFD